MLAAVVLGAVLPMAGFFVVEYRRAQRLHEECEKKHDTARDSYQTLTERVVSALERQARKVEPPKDPTP